MGRSLYDLSLSEAPSMDGAERLVINKSSHCLVDSDDMSIDTPTPRPDGPGLRQDKTAKNIRRGMPRRAECDGASTAVRPT
jgi:hypothetical protein